MALEDLTGSSKFIDDLVATNPVGATDPKSEGDDHIRGLKNVLRNCFEFVTGAVTATHTELSHLASITADAILFLAATDYADMRTQMDVEQVDADLLRADTSDQLEVGFTTGIFDHGIISSGTVTLDLTERSIQKVNVQGDFTIAAPSSGNGYIQLKVTNAGSGPHTITLSGITQLSGIRNLADGGIDFWRITRIDGGTFLEVVNVS